MAYPRGWPVMAQTVVRKERWPGGNGIRCTPLVSVGQRVLPDQPVMRVECDTPAEVMQLPPHLALPSSTTTGIKAVRKDIQGKRDTEVVPAGMHGRVVEITGRGGVVIESRAAVVRGTIGVGSQVAGILAMWPSNGPGTGQQIVPPGAILIVPGPLNFTMLRQAASSGIAGIIASSILAHDLEGFLRTDLIHLLYAADVERAQAYLPSLGLLLTEGFGTVAMPAYVLNLLSHYHGSVVLLSGMTSLRHRTYPELIISQPEQETPGWTPVEPDFTLRPGAQVRICSGELKGAVGVIDYLFTHQQRFSSGVRDRAVRLRLDDGSLVVVPVTLLERIG